MIQAVATNSNQKEVESFVGKIRDAWKEVILSELGTLTFFAYKWQERDLREAYEQIKNDPDFSHLFFRWNGVDETKSISFSISLRELPDKPLKEVLPPKEISQQKYKKAMRPLFEKKRKKRK